MKDYLYKKYNVQTPRYTSFPTIPFWSDDYKQTMWQSDLVKSFEKNGDDGVSLYIHLPYCEHLCTYCGCHKFITTKHVVEDPYIAGVLKEWSLYENLLKKKITINEIHLGGGTPTFFSAQNLKVLIEGILNHHQLSKNAELSIEVHPSYTSFEQLETLKNLGFNRISIGVQDFDPKVQEAISRIQPFSEVKQLTDWSRELNYESVNFDLIYGLPFQTLDSIKDNFRQVLELKPDRIAYYAYAHVPWTKKAQRLYDDNDLPRGEEKRELYDLGFELLLEAGYVEVGMDHFALPDDKMAIAHEENELHRNFMGYTTNTNKILIGLGVSSISDAWSAYSQNEKALKPYLEKVNNYEFPTIKGYQLTEKDLLAKEYILDIICHHKTTFNDDDQRIMEMALPRLKEFEEDGLLGVFENGILLSENGKTFVRNICMAFDHHMFDKDPEIQMFSSSV
jgi:oxygen-independent coproporphyrinogen-3 oxidase